MKPVLVLMVGLPRSGKSTATVRNFRGSVPIICPDNIRKVLGCFPFVPSREKEVWHIVRTAIEALFMSGAPVVVLDATNVTKKRRKEWMSDTWKTAAVWIDTSSDVCKERATANNQPDLLDVIDRMADAFEAPTREEGLTWVERFRG